MSDVATKTLDVEKAVRERYAQGAREREAELCCPVEYSNADLLEAIPDEVIERDYGCGNPTVHLRPGETVLDLGSGAGKHCFMAAQVVGREGNVIGVDVNDEMLDLARRSAPVVAERIGYANVSFRKAKIEDMSVDLDALDECLAADPVKDVADYQRLETRIGELRRERPAVAGGSVDVVISNCVLNLVEADSKRKLFAEIYRVLRNGGRAVISDIVADEDVPAHLQNDPELWSGCVSGALREDQFLRAFEDAGFYGVEVVAFQKEPWRTVEGIEFRSMTVIAHKGKEGPCLERKQAVIYKGPFREVRDDDGHAYRRGERTAVCEKTFRILTRPPYAGTFEPIEPRIEVPAGEAGDFLCSGKTLRHPRESKGLDYSVTTGDPGAVCSTDDDCC